MSKPLEGVKVIELATFIAAATAGRFMADLGADVIKIESAKGDPLRSPCSCKKTSLSGNKCVKD